MDSEYYFVNKVHHVNISYIATSGIIYHQYISVDIIYCYEWNNNLFLSSYKTTVR